MKCGGAVVLCAVSTVLFLAVCCGAVTLRGTDGETVATRSRRSQLALGPQDAVVGVSEGGEVDEGHEWDSLFSAPMPVLEEYEEEDLDSHSLRFVEEGVEVGRPRAQTVSASYSNVDTRPRRPALLKSFRDLAASASGQNGRIPNHDAPSASRPPAGPNYLRYVTYNVQKFLDTANNLKLDEQVADLKDINADVAMLQEVQVFTNKEPKFSSVKSKLEAIGYTDVIMCNAVTTTTMKFGNILASKLEVVSHSEPTLTDSQSREARCAVIAKLKMKDQWPGKTASGPGSHPVVAVAVHLDVHDDTGAIRVEEVQDLLRNRLTAFLTAADLSTKNVIIGGDFNAMYKSQVVDQAWSRWQTHDRARTRTDTLTLDHVTVAAIKKLGWTESFEMMGYTPPTVTTWSGRRVDYLWFSPRFGMHLRWTGVYYTANSDHFPVIADVKMPAVVTHNRVTLGTVLPTTATLEIQRPTANDDHHVGFVLRKGYTSGGGGKAFKSYKERCALVFKDTTASTATNPVFYALFFEVRNTLEDQQTCSPNIKAPKKWIKIVGGPPSTLTADTAQAFGNRLYATNGVNNRAYKYPASIPSKNDQNTAITMRLAFKTSDARMHFARTVKLGTLWAEALHTNLATAAAGRSVADQRLALDRIGVCANDAAWNRITDTTLANYRDAAKAAVTNYAPGDASYDARHAILVLARQRLKSVSTINVPNSLGNVLAKSQYQKNTWQLPGEDGKAPKKMSSTTMAYMNGRADAEMWLFGYKFPDQSLYDAENRPLSVSEMWRADPGGPAKTYGHTVLFLSARTKPRSIVSAMDTLAMAHGKFKAGHKKLDKNEETSWRNTPRINGKTFKSIRMDAKLARPGANSHFGIGAGKYLVGTEAAADGPIAVQSCTSMLNMLTKGQNGGQVYPELNILGELRLDDVQKVTLTQEECPASAAHALGNDLKGYVAFGRAHSVHVECCKQIVLWRYGTAMTCTTIYNCDATQDRRCEDASGWATDNTKPLP